MYINLIDKLSDLDKKRIENYISLYGTSSYFIGLDKWLQNWSHSKQTLYKLLGNSFIREIDFSYNMSKEILNQRIEALVKNSEFLKQYISFCKYFIDENPDIEYSNFLCLISLKNSSCFVENATKKLIKFKKNPNAKLLQIQPGTKIIKAFNKVIDYFSDDYPFNKEAFEELKINYSIILTTKKIKAKMVYSIHPLDFLTMSDNDSSWTSCMSWTDKGCYHLGTVEMMNSNNVICCYIKSDNDYFFCKNKNFKEDPSYWWNNKTWRNLVYITKDIIMSGKSYPYEQEDFSKILIKEVKKMAETNLHWSYTFGPELYLDMNHVYDLYNMNTIRNYIYNKNKKEKRHNIIWDTNGMYNDMLNDHRRAYWCYRNKVNSTKIISVSGKAPCLCCGNDDVLEDNLIYDEYNERYNHTGTIICENCYNKYFKNTQKKIEF